MAAAALALDTDALGGAAGARTLAACVPTAQEAKLLAAYARHQPSLHGLTDAELFCYDLLQVGSAAAPKRHSHSLVGRQALRSSMPPQADRASHASSTRE